MKKYLFIIITLITSLVATSCQDEDFGFTEQDVFQGKYARNFIKEFGAIDPNQSWDLSSYAKEQRLIEVSTRATRGAADEWYYVEPGTIDDYIKTNLPEGKNNKSGVSNFALLSNGMEFEIIPLYQAGDQDVDWKLHAVLVTTSGAKDKIIFDKSDQNQIEVLGQEHICETCHGHRIVAGSGEHTCTLCQGTGHLAKGGAEAIAINCSNCNGTHTVKEQCSTCQGKGYTGTCSNCKGQGYKYQWWWLLGGYVGCDVCGGSGSRNLLDFNYNQVTRGTGKATCSICDGSGEVDAACTHCTDGHQYLCGICGGKGKGDWCPTCDGTGTVKNPSWEKLTKKQDTKNASAIRTKPTTVNSSLFDGKSTKDGLIYFYLEITTGKNNYATTGVKQSSISSMMKMIDCGHPTNIDPSYEVKMIGCEEANGRNTDNDYNDFVFLLVGHPRIPSKINISAGGTYNKIVDKRYMIEDMGSAVDWDFNDIVVDVIRTTTMKLNSSASSLSQTAENTNAIIQWLGGTAPIEVLINGKTVGCKINDPANQEQTLKQIENQDPPKKPTEFTGETIGWPVGKSYSVTGWNPDTNNISVKVWKKGSTDATTGVWEVKFSKTGDVPYIIATDLNVDWERTDGKNISDDLWKNKADTSTDY